MKTSNHKCIFIQKVDFADRYRWHECVICKKSEECNCSEGEFNNFLYLSDKRKEENANS